MEQHIRITWGSLTPGCLGLTQSNDITLLGADPGSISIF